jgi:hypothetical protein
MTTGTTWKRPAAQGEGANGDRSMTGYASF